MRFASAKRRYLPVILMTTPSLFSVTPDRCIMSRTGANGSRNLYDRITWRSTRDWKTIGRSIFIDENASAKDRWVTQGSENGGIMTNVSDSKVIGWPSILRRSRFWHWERVLRNSVRFPMLLVESSCRFSMECHGMSGRAHRQDHRMVRNSKLWVLKRRSASKPRFFNSIHFKLENIR